MSEANVGGSSLRLWPGVGLTLLLVVVRFVLPLAAPDALLFGMPLAMLGFLGGVALGALILAWWLLASRAPWTERIGAIAVMAAVLMVTRLFVHPSIENGMMGGMLYVFSLPLLAVALVAWAAAARGLHGARRWTTMATALVIACSPMLVIRTGGISGEGQADLHWRWTPTPEERLLASARSGAISVPPEPRSGGTSVPPEARSGVTSVPPEPRSGGTSVPPEARSDGTSVPPEVRSGGTSVPPEARSGGTSVPPMTRDTETSATPVRTEPTPAEWPGFRGPGRDSVVRGVRLETAWPTAPPVELWRRPIGPAWSSFAVRGDVAYTQEQRGEEEMVVAYRVSTGEPVWQHRDAVRFWESNGGAGPRATPTLHGGRVYTMGATGVVNALDAATGAKLWTRNAATDAAVSVPDWGFSASPLVVDDVVVVALSGRLAGYDAHTGAPRWMGPTGGGGYSSPHLITVDGVPQVLLMRGARTLALSPADGSLLWEHTWEPAVSIVQPAVVEAGHVLVTAGDGMGGGGLRRLAIAKSADGWTVEERWTSRGLKPYFNDLVVHNGFAYGFDGSILACVDLADGTRKWKGGRYGHGQMVLLADQSLLLVLSEDGELALVNATPDKFTEVARMRALEGKTWNHPVVVGDTILVRNGEEMVAFRSRRQETGDRR